MKKSVFGVITGVLLCMLCACGEKENETAASSKEYVYRGEEVVIEGIENSNAINEISIKNGKLYIRSNYWTEDTSVMTLISQNPDGSEMQKLELQTFNNVFYSWLTPDGNGNYYAVIEESFEDNSNPDNYVWRMDYYLTKLDVQGTEVFRQKLNESESEDYWVQWIQLLPDQRLVVCDSTGIVLYDAEGTKIKDVTPSKPIESYGVYLMEDGTLLIDSYNPETNQSFMNKLNVDTGEVSEDYTLPNNSGSFSFYPGKGYDLFLVGNGAVYGYNLGDTDMKKLMDLVDSDVNSSYIYNLAAVSETEFYAMLEDETVGHTQVMRFTKVDPKDVADKMVLTLACNNLNWEVRSHVVEFNKTNPKYRIVIEDYSQYNTDEDYSVGMTRLNADIVSGKVPDILLLDWQMPVDSYVAKGLFEDLYPYIDKDEELKREDFFPNVLAAYENEGKLYRLVPRFMVYTVAGKTSDVGVEPGWTLEELKQLVASKPEDMQIFEEATLDRMLSYSIQMSGEQFIDWETGECHFNSDGFIALLEFLKQFPKQLEDDYYDDAYWENYSAMWREGKVLLQMLYLADFSSYNYAKKGTFGEDITLVGFPMEEGNGSAIAADMELAMSSKSKYKDGAWEFMRFFLTDEYQDQITYEWPVRLSRIDELAKEAMKKPYYEDENGNIIEYEPTFSIGGQEIPLELLTQEEIDELIAFIKSVDQRYVYNQQLEAIIAEEAASYFAGQKSAKEVADIIQSRVQIYVNENR